jgi:hypothetical protein
MTTEEIRARRREYTRKWRAANPEYNSKCYRKWRVANPNGPRDKSRKYRAANRERANEKSRKWYAANRERVLEKAKRKRLADPRRLQDIHLKSKYGITREQYENILIAQGYVCLCGEPFGDGLEKPVIDHHHATGKVRGILHNRCNIWIGQRDPEILKRFRNQKGELRG